MEEDTFECEKIEGVELNKLKGVRVVEMDASTNTEYSAEQESYLQKLRIKEVGSQLNIPTEESKVKEWLRRISEPVTRFGEGPYERRERLRLLLASNQSFLKIIKESVGGEGGKELESSNKDKDEYFVNGGEALLEARKWILADSLQRSKTRLLREKEFYIQSATDLYKKRVDLGERIKNVQYVGGIFCSERPLSAVSFCPADADQFVVGSFGGELYCYDRNNFTLKSTFQTNQLARIGAIKFNPSNSLIFSTCNVNGIINLWNLNNELPIITFEGSKHRIGSIAFHPSGQYLASSSYDNSWSLWNINNSNIPTRLLSQVGHTNSVHSIDFHPDGSLVATGSLDNNIRLWDVRSGKSIWLIQGHVKTPLHLSFHPIKPLLASSGEDGSIRIWDLRAIKPLSVIPAHSAPVSSVKWSMEGEVLVSADFDGVLKIWGGVDWRPLNSLCGHDGKIMSLDCRYESEGSSLSVITASVDRSIKLWE